jgi:hypothetical protein
MVKVDSLSLNLFSLPIERWGRGATDLLVRHAHVESFTFDLCS